VIGLLTTQPIADAPLGVLADTGSDTASDIWHGVLDVVADIFLSTNIGPLNQPWPAANWTVLGIAGSFLISRGITRYIRARGADKPSTGPVKDIVIGGVHIHHQVFGIVLMVVSGVCMIASQPSGVLLNVLAGAFGVGVGLTFDEFALWLHLEDVYWAEEGRKSIDAVAIVCVLVGELSVLVAAVEQIVVSAPIVDINGQVELWTNIAATVIFFLPAIFCLLKGKPIAAGGAVIYLPIGLIGAFRLAKPTSWWAKHFYGATSRRRRRAEARFGPAYQARWNRIRDLVGGAPSRAT
jgi:hypothetical protein